MSLARAASCAVLAAVAAGSAVADVNLATKPKTILDAVQLILLGGPYPIKLDDDAGARDALEKVSGKKSRLRITVNKIGDLREPGCMRVAWQIVALDIPIKTVTGKNAALTVTTQLSLCRNGQPPQPDDLYPPGTVIPTKAPG